MSTRLLRSPYQQSIDELNEIVAWDISAADNVTLQIIGTFNGTLTFEATGDLQNWFAVALVKLGTGIAATTTTSTGQYAVPNSGLVGLRVNATAWFSGSANITATHGPEQAISAGGSSSSGGGLAPAGTATLSNISDSATSVTLLAANPLRLGFAFYNDSGAKAYVKPGATASTTSFMKIMLPDDFVTSGDLGVDPTVRFDAIWVTAPGGFMRVVEWSA